MFMRTSFIIIAVAIFSCFPVLGRTGELKGNFTIATGLLLTDDDFSQSFDLDKRIEVGVVCDAGKQEWPVSIVAAYFFSYGNSKLSDNPQGFLNHQDVDVFCSETYLGLEKIFDWSPSIKPYLACGLCSHSAYADISYDDDYDWAFGSWFGVGGYVTISRNWLLNMAWRRSRVKVNLFDHHLDAGGDHFDLSVGYHFPK